MQPDTAGLIRCVQLEFNDMGDLVDVTTNRDVGETPESERCATIVEAIGAKLRKGQRIDQQLEALRQVLDVLAELALHQRTAGKAVRETAAAMRKSK